MTLFALLYDTGTILSPFLILGLYPSISTIRWLGSPKLVVPVAVLGSAYAFILTGGASVTGFFIGDHFLIAAVVLLLAYSLFLRYYRPTDSVFLALLVIIAADQLWQVPLDAVNWSASLLAAETGLATVAFSLMSIPVLFWLLEKLDGSVRFSWKLLLICIAMTVAEFPFLKPGDASVWFSPLTTIVWAVFLIHCTLRSREAKQK